MSRTFLSKILATSAVLVSTNASAVPTAFLLTEAGNQHDANWKTVESKKFKIYHEEKAQHLADHAIKSVELAWSYLSFLFNEKMADEPESERFCPRQNTEDVLFSPITLVLNSRADVGGFANFATQNIEVQMQTGATAALFQHELVHHVMYERMDPNFGPGGRAFTVGMMPTWWIEGVSEYLTESMGRPQSSGIARTMALKNTWPTWDSLHNLYNSQGDYGKGYVTSGRFFGFLRSKTPATPISEMHDSFFWRTFIPPFVTASKLTTSKLWGASGPELYAEFQKDHKNYWEKELAGMPTLESDKSSLNIGHARNVPRTIVLDEKTILQSDLEAKPFESESALAIYSLESGKKIRMPVSIEGSPVFAMAPWERVSGGFWTTTDRLFSNGVRGSDVRYIRFKNDITTIDNNALKQRLTFPVSTSKRPVLVGQIKALGNEKAFAVGTLKGDSVLYYIDAEKKQFEEKKRWPAPTRVKLIESAANFNSSNQLCVHAIVDLDQERTSLEKFCADGTQSTVLQPEKLYILNAIERAPENFLLQIAWGSATGLVEFKDGNITSGFPIPDWGEELIPWNKESREAGLWVFNGERFNLTRFSFDKLLANWTTWSTTLPSASPWKKIPQWTPFVPPFVRVAEQEKSLLPAPPTPASDEQNKESSGSVANTPKPTEAKITPKSSLTRTSAPYAGRTFFSYPNMLPPYFGGWAVGLISIPYMDEMERHRVEVSGQYYFPTQSPNIEVRYVSNRIFDGFALSAFTTSRYNGAFFNQYCKDDSTNKYKICGSSQYPVRQRLNLGIDDYLRDTGFSVATSRRFLPSSVVLELSSRVSRIEPYTELIRDSEVDTLGTQKGVIGTIGANVAGKLHSNAFYMGPAHETGHHYLVWGTSYSLFAETQHGIGKSWNYRDEVLPAVNFQKFRLSGTSAFLYRSHSLSLHGEVGGTTGSNPLNLREVFQPYRTYLLGSGSAINGVNVPLLGDGGVFARSTGAYSFRSDVTYSFPVFNNIDYEFLILYLESIHGEVVVGRGGVARTEKFNNFITRDSASMALRATINIKGFQIFPSVAYGQLIGEPGWSLFSELSFSQFF